MTRFLPLLVCILVLTAAWVQAETPENFRDENLVAWCIVPFDSEERSPAERAAMVKQLGLRRVAYDWRPAHVPLFEAEIHEYAKHGLEYFAFWSKHDRAFDLFQQHNLHPQIWQTAPSPVAATHEERVQKAAADLLPLVEKTRTLGCKLGLYNHGGWGGEPENLIAVCEYLRKHLDAAHVGIVYNLHHAHDQMDNFAAVLKRLKPYLFCLNLNGMTKEGDKRGQKILPIGAGELDQVWLQAVLDSGYTGPIGIIGHTQDDVQQRLQDNLDGLHWLLARHAGNTELARPAYRTWKSPDRSEDSSATPDQSNLVPPAEYSAEFVDRLLVASRTRGDATRGVLVFGSAKAACISCHKIHGLGGPIGPELTQITKTRKPEELIESILWPKRHVEEKYRAQRVLDIDGRMHTGYVVRRDEKVLVLRQAAQGNTDEVKIFIDEIDFEQELGTVMPDNLTAAMTEQQLLDVVRFVTTLGTDDGLPEGEFNSVLSHSLVHQHGPAEFEWSREPLDSQAWPHWQHAVNRGRVYDFYTKQADYFRRQSAVPHLLAEFPGLDGGSLGHWGNQNDTVWADDRWNDTDLGSFQSGVFRGAGITIPRGLCVRLGENNEYGVCFNPDTLQYEAVWKDGFLSFSSARHGFMHGVNMKGTPLPKPEPRPIDTPFQYQGLYRVGTQVAFRYKMGDTIYLDVPTIEGGKFISHRAPFDEHPLRRAINNPPRHWSEELTTEITLGQESPYAVDTIALPFENPWNALIFAGGHDFLPDGSALVCTMQGDVWHVSGFAYPSQKATWRRFASGLHQALGMVIDEDGIFVLGRDQITRLHDLNGDGEADYYECFSNAYQTSPAGHDFTCGLERDNEGRFYIASGNQGVVRISADGQHAEVLATGFRNPDGIGLTPDGLVTVPCSEGNWTPASMICAFTPKATEDNPTPPHFGYPGPRKDEMPSLPMVYLPRGLDNSSGGQTYISSDRWGPLQRQMVHFSFGLGSHFLLLRDQVDGQWQGAVVPLAGEFRSGAHRGRFSPHDGQLYVSGMQGWGSYTVDDGCFQRVRYTGQPVQMPTQVRVHQNGVALNFSRPIDRQTASNIKNHFAQSWNYRYGPGYGSPEFSAQHAGMRGHDTLKITAAYLADDGHTLFLEIPEVQPVNVLHLQVRPDAGTVRDLFVTVHKLAEPYTAIQDYQPVAKSIRPHPLIADLAMATRSVPNPHREKIADARKITIKTGTNLTFEKTSIRVKAGETIALTLANPDVVPHNWALTTPGNLEAVGDLSNRLISDPDAALRHYIPESDSILAYTDVVLPGEKFTIYFRAPTEPGRYPYLCTFPGHWKVMNGEMIVE